MLGGEVVSHLVFVSVFYFLMKWHHERFRALMNSCHFTKMSNFSQLHWRSNGVAAELASLEKSNFKQLEAKGFYGTLLSVCRGLQLSFSGFYEGAYGAAQAKAPVQLHGSIKFQNTTFINRKPRSSTQKTFERV